MSVNIFTLPQFLAKFFVDKITVIAKMCRGECELNHINGEIRHMRNVEPKVYLLAKSSIEAANTHDWLTDLGVSDAAVERIVDGNKTDAERIIEVAGRRCYKSFEPHLNPNVTKIREDIGEYIENILKVGHGCYDASTDVLTSEGWRAWPDVTQADRLATRNANGQVEYHLPKKLVRADYGGRMYRVDAEGVDLLVTPNHNMLVCKTTTREGRRKQNFELIKAEDLNLASHAYTKTAIWSGGAPIDFNVMRLLGFSIGDGNLNLAKSSQVRFHLHKQRKILWLKGICQSLNWNMTDGDGGRYSVNIPDEFRQLFEQMYNEDGEKKIPQHLITHLSKECLSALFEGLMQSDGSEGRTSDVYDTTSEILAGQIQQLCLHIGLAANISQAQCYKDREHSFGDRPIHRLGIITRALKPEVNKWSGAYGKTSWVDEWQGEIFCAEVQNNTLYVRRNGKPVWCGNSVTEHATFTFAIENVSRVFTGEMNRHRAGMAISEGSMRYIRYEDIPYWVPTSIQGPEDNINHRGSKYHRSILTWALACTLRGLRDNEEVCGPDLDFVKQMLEWAEKYHESTRIPVESEDEKKDMSRKVFKFVFGVAESCYDVLQSAWKKELAPDSKFKAKKEITSMMRRIIPMGVATGGIWTGNLRALRHICEMRCSAAAEEEILLVATQMLNIMREEEPSFFKDFTTDENGLSAPKFKKV